MTEYKGTTHTIMDLLERNKREKIKNVPRPEDGPRTNIKNTARPGDADPKSEKSLLPKEDEIRTKVIDETKIAQSKSKPEDLKKPKKLEIGDVGKQPPTQVIINPELDRNNLGENKSLNEGDVTVQYQLNNGKWISARSCPRSPAEILMAMQAVQETFRFNRVRVVDESGNLVDIASNVPLSLTGGPRDVVTGRDVNETKKPGLIIKTIAMLAGQDHPLGRYAIYKIGKYEADEAQDRADKRNKEMVDAIRGKKERNEETLDEKMNKKEYKKAQTQFPNLLKDTKYKKYRKHCSEKIKEENLDEISQKAKLDYLSGANAWDREAKKKQDYANYKGDREGAKKIVNARGKRLSGISLAVKKFRSAEDAGKTKNEEILDEAHKIHDKVEITKGTHKGKKAVIRSIIHGAHKTAQKRYDVDHLGGGEYDQSVHSSNEIRSLKEGLRGQLDYPGKNREMSRDEAKEKIRTGVRRALRRKEENKKQHPKADMDFGFVLRPKVNMDKINKKMDKAAVKDKDGKITHYDMTKEEKDCSCDHEKQKAKRRSNTLDWMAWSDAKKKEKKIEESLTSGSKSFMSSRHTGPGYNSKVDSEELLKQRAEANKKSAQGMLKYVKASRKKKIEEDMSIASSIGSKARSAYNSPAGKKIGSAINKSGMAVASAGTSLSGAVGSGSGPVGAGAFASAGQSIGGSGDVLPAKITTDYIAKNKNKNSSSHPKTSPGVQTTEKTK